MKLKRFTLFILFICNVCFSQTDNISFKNKITYTTSNGESSLLITPNYDYQLIEKSTDKGTFSMHYTYNNELYKVQGPLLNGKYVDFKNQTKEYFNPVTLVKKDRRPLIDVKSLVELPDDQEKIGDYVCKIHKGVATVEGTDYNIYVYVTKNPEIDFTKIKRTFETVFGIILPNTFGSDFITKIHLQSKKISLDVCTIKEITPITLTYGISKQRIDLLINSAITSAPETKIGNKLPNTQPAPVGELTLPKNRPGYCSELNIPLKDQVIIDKLNIFLDNMCDYFDKIGYQDKQDYADYYDKELTNYITKMYADKFLSDFQSRKLEKELLMLNSLKKEIKK